MPGGRLLLPALPQKRLLPWLLGGAGISVLIYGLVDGDAVTAVLGAGALAAALVAFPLARLVLGPEPAEGADGDAQPTSDQDKDGPPTYGSRLHSFRAQHRRSGPRAYRLRRGAGVAAAAPGRAA